MTEKFKQLLETAKRVLITSHISPDPDAVSSVLLLGTVIRKNFPDKQIRMVLEEEPTRDLSFLFGYKDVVFRSLLDAAKEFKPDLFIMVDAMNYGRVSRSDADKLSSFLRESKSKTATLDHHTEVSRDDVDIYINDHLPATAQQIYKLAFDDWGLQKPDGYAQTTLLGIISDTARFKYDNPAHRQTFKIIDELLDNGASIEALENRLERYSPEQMLVFSNLAKNVTDSGSDYTYSFIDDGFSQKIKDQTAFKVACELFTSQFTRSIGDNLWGFLVYPEELNGKPAYSVSFRSANRVRDVAELAGKLGGGGHKRASGAKGIQATSVQDAVKKVQTAIEATD